MLYLIFIWIDISSILSILAFNSFDQIAPNPLSENRLSGHFVVQKNIYELSLPYMSAAADRWLPGNQIGL
ncbi:MAG TPA: hypothetical protein DCY03_14325 [Planctomycetaceae bacterium]|nr:hypothetical protein [Planctomycetaceae bacterium]